MTDSIPLVLDVEMRARSITENTQQALRKARAAGIQRFCRLGIAAEAVLA